MIGILAQKGLGRIFGAVRTRDATPASSEHARLIDLLDMLVDECAHDADGLSDIGLMPDRYYLLARAAAQGHYRIEPGRIAERLLRH